MKNIIRHKYSLFTFCCLILLTIIYHQLSTSQFQIHKGAEQERVKGIVTGTKELSKHIDKFQVFTEQQLSINVMEGQRKINVQSHYESDGRSRFPLQAGDEIILTKINIDGKTMYSYTDRYRLDRLFYITIGFFILVLLLTGQRGFGTIAGLVISILVVFSYIVPQILMGIDPFIVSVIGSFAILFLSMYPAHGFTKQTTAALIATVLVLLFIVFFSKFLVWFTFLTGYSTDDAFGITNINGHVLNIRELLIGGIIIATAGALDDVTTGQAAAVFQMAKLQKDISVFELIKKGMLVGQEHVIALINTLVIAFVGSGFTFFVSLFLYYGYEGVWVVINREFISEELVKSLAISTGLILAVPISTIFSAFMVKKIFIKRNHFKDKG